MISEKLSGAVIRLAKVTEVHPEGNAVDVIFMDDASTATGVLVVAPLASTRSGRVDLPEPETPPQGKWSLNLTEEQDILAVIAMTELQPLVLGFLFPQINQVLFDKAEFPDFAVYRHVSDVYQTIHKNGDTEVYHPSGTYLRIAKKPGHEDLTGKDYDKKWKIDRNTKEPVHVVIDANEGMTTFHIDTGGNVTLTTLNNIDIRARKGQITITAQRDVVVRGATIRLN